MFGSKTIIDLLDLNHGRLLAKNNSLLRILHATRLCVDVHN